MIMALHLATSSVARSPYHQVRFAPLLLVPRVASILMPSCYDRVDEWGTLSDNKKGEGMIMALKLCTLNERSK